jgi:phosphodiesterase/alkaline phosphatase D-like protein
MVARHNLRGPLILCLLFAVFSIANAQTPLPMASGYLLANGPGEPLQFVTDAVKSGNYLYTVSSSNDEFTIVDISNPAAPEIVSTLLDGEGGTTMNDPLAIAVSGNLAYIVSSNSKSLEILDISDPNDPTHVGTLIDLNGDPPTSGPGPYLSFPADIVVSGGYAYIAIHYGLEVVDVSDPANPVHVSNLYLFPSATPPTPPDLYLEFVRAVQVQGNYAYILGRLGNDNGFMTIDISDPGNPTSVAFLAHGNLVNGPILSNPQALLVEGNYAYITTDNDALEILDITNPLAPTHLSFIKNNSTPGIELDGPRGIDIEGDYAYIVTQNSQAVEILDISDPSAPEHVTAVLSGDNGEPPYLGSGTTIHVDGNFAYTCGFGLQILSIFLPGPPEVDEGLTLGQEFDKSTTIRIRWNQVDGLTYTLEVSADDFITVLPGYDNVAVTGTEAQGSPMGWLQTHVTGLTPNTTYKFRMKAINANGASDPSTPIAVTTAPSPPVALAATSIEHDGAIVNWQASPAATQYFIYLYDQGHLGFPNQQFTGYPAGNVTSFEIGGSTIFPAFNYKFRVTAYNANGESGYSNIIDFTTKPWYTTFLSATTITATSFVANWNDDPAPLAVVTGFFLDVATDAAFTQMVPGYDNLDVGDVTSKFVDSGLTPGTTYYYRVRTANASGSSPNSPDPMSVTTAPPPPTLNDASETTTTSFKANWNAATGATGYRIDVSTNSGFTSFVPLHNDKSVPVSPTNVTVSGLVAGTTYYYRVRAVNSGGTSGIDGVEEVVTLPVAPAAAAATGIGQAAFTANWGTVPSATKYSLDVSTDIAFSTFVDTYDNLEVNALTKGVTGLSANTTYYYRVRAVNESGSSANSSTITVLTAPTAPVAEAATVIQHNTATLNWQSVTGATHYKIYLYDNGNLGSPNSTFNSYNVGNVTFIEVSGSSISSATTYKYRVTSANASGESDFSNLIDFTTKPNYTTFLPATSITATSFMANWSDDAGVVTGFFLDVGTDAAFTQLVTGYDNLDVGDVTSRLVNTGLSAGITYYYRVRTANASGSSPNSPSPISVSTTPPAPVLNDATAITTTSFTASWNATSGATGYRIDVSTNAGFTSFVPSHNDKLVPASPTTLTVSGLVAGTTYYYRVRAENTGGTSDTNGVTEVVTLPVAPVATAASGIGPLAFTANWGTVSGATHYFLDVSTDNSFATFVGGFDNFEVTGLTTGITGLVENTAYYYRVRAANASGSSVNSNTVSVLTAPTGPVATAATSIQHDRAIMNWQSVPGATGYKIYLYNDGNLGTPNSTYNGFNTGNVTTYEVSGSSISAAANYKFRVTATSASGESNFSNAIDFTTKPNYPVLLAATTVTATSFIANWSDDAGVVSGYFLDVATDAAFLQMVSGYDNVDVGDVTSKLVDTGLSAGTTYYYRVRTANASGASPNSPNPTSVITTPPPPALNTATLMTTTSFTASWNAATGATGYRVDVATNAGFTNFVPLHNDKAVPATPTELEVTGLTSGVTYYYRVRAVNSGGTSGTQGVTEVVTLPLAPDATPASQVGQTAFTANWNSVQSATHYFIDVSTDLSFANLVVDFDNLQVNGLTTNVTGLSGNATYYYRVRAANASGSSADSDIITVLTAPSAPVATDALTPTLSSFVATWNAVTNATAYKVDVSTASNFPSFVPGFEDATATTTSLNVSGLTPGTIYHYRVRATNGSGTSDNSNVISQITIPAAPATEEADAIEQTSFTAKWQTATGATEFFVDVFDEGDDILPGYENVSVGTETELLVDTGVEPGTTYSYVVRAINSAGTSSNSAARDVLTLPPTPVVLVPVISGRIDFKARWQASKSATGYLITIRNKDGNPLGGGFTNSDVGNSLEATITVNADAEGAVFFYEVKARNGSGDSPYSDQMIVNTPAVTFPSILLPTGGTTATYKIISIPDGTTPSTTLSDESLRTNWRIMRYNSVSAVNEDVPLASMTAGLGYWVNSNIDPAPAITLTGQTLPTTKTLTLLPGWNQIGNPFNFDISWSDVLAKNAANASIDDVGNLFTYNVPSVNGQYNDYDGLKGYGGGFVNNTSSPEVNITLTLPADVERFNGRKGSRNAINSRDIAEDQWFIPLTLEVGGKINDLGGFGMHPDSRTSIDRFDAIALPRLSHIPELSSNHPEFFQPRFMKDVVPTADMQTWKFDISPPEQSSDARLTWDNTSWSGAVLYLIDEAAGAVVNMNEMSEYAFSTHKTKSVTFAFGRHGHVAPDITAFGQPFPNPSADRVTFPFVARQGESINIQVMDLTGRSVGSMKVDNAMAGYQEAIWDSKETNGLPPGVYLYQFTTSAGLRKAGRIVLK